MKKLLFGCAILALAAPAAYAQETTASIRGSVDDAGNPVANATVTVTHVPSGTRSTAVTGVDGGFSLQSLRVGGPFTVTVAAEGYPTATINELMLSAGQPLRLPVTLQGGDVITVTAAQVQSTEVSMGPISTYGLKEIEGVASIARDIRDIARRDPFVTMDLTNSRTIEVAGQNGRLNRFSVDGVQFSDDFGLNNGGLPTSRGPVPFDAIEQLSVKVAPYDISEGDFQGGAINMVLRSGGNDFKGAAFFTYSDDSLTGDKTRDASPDLNFDSKQYGLFASGPIVQDKLFFMFGYEKLKEKDPFDDGVGPGFANQVPGITIDQVNQVMQIAEDVYGYDTLGQIQNAVEEDEKIVAKLDWNISDDHRASLTYIRNVGSQQFQQNTFTTPPTALGLFSNGYELKEEINSGVLQLNSTWSDTFSTEVRAAYRDYNRDQTPFGGRDISQFEVCLDPTNPTGNSATSCATSRIFFGPDVSRQANDLNQENLSIDFTGRISLGDHQVKLTAGYTDIDTYNLFLQRATGDLYFDSLADFQAQRANRLRLGGAVPSLDPNDAAARFSTQTYTFGVQDEWNITPELQASLGARYDLYHNPDRPTLNPDFLARNGFANTATFNGRGVFQPRFGITWQPTQRFVLRGGAGIFAGGSPDVFLSNSFSNTGQLTNQIDINRANCAASGTCAALDGVTGANFPSSVTDFLTTNTASLASAPVNAIDPDLDLARQFRATLSANYDADLGALGDGWLFGADFLYGNVVRGYTWTDLRSVPIGTLPDGRPRYGPINGVATTNQDLLMTNDNRGRSYIGVARLSKEWDFGLSIDASYTRSDIKDTNALTSATAGSLYGNNAFADPNFAAYGRSIYEIRDQWKFSVDFKREFFGDNETRFSLFGEYRTGRPYSVTMLDRSSGRSAVLGTVGNGGRALLYVPTANDPLVVFDSVASETAFNNLITDLGLGKYRGKVVPKNSQDSPDFFKVDLHISQEVPAFIGSSKIKLFADVENFLNMLDKDWGALRQVAFPYTAAVVDVACVTVSNGSCTQYRYSNVTSPNKALSARQSLYQIRVGVRFEF